IAGRPEGGLGEEARGLNLGDRGVPVEDLVRDVVVAGPAPLGSAVPAGSTRGSARWRAVGLEAGRVGRRSASSAAGECGNGQRERQSSQGSLHPTLHVICVKRNDRRLFEDVINVT